VPREEQTAVAEGAARAAASLPPQHRVIYDSDCGLCLWVMGLMLIWDARRALRPVALRDPVARELLADMSECERAASWHLVTPSGERYSAGRAVAPLLRLLPGGRPIAAAAAALQPLTDRAYDFLASRRSLFGKAVGDRATRRALGRIRKRATAR
jgi:predicted DCC family thiol-disulfide oxidoreductase YuxK